MRPTGKLHLGNYMGALANWVKLQNSAQYECYFFIADWHALTTDYADPSRLKLKTIDVALDYLAAGLNPEIHHLHPEPCSPARRTQPAAGHDYPPRLA
jgi:tryptophanyl-tRNA synthetase